MKCFLSKLLRSALLLGTALHLTNTVAHALAIDTNPGNGQHGALSSLEPTAFGQTITVVAGSTRLDSFSFRLDDFASRGSTSVPNLAFAGYVMAWNGLQATGPVLYDSGVTYTTNQAGFETFTFSPVGGLDLTAGSQYVLLLSTNSLTSGSLFGGSSGFANMQMRSDNPYADGKFVYTTGDLAGLTNTAWRDDMVGYDAAFTATFSGAPALLESAAAVPDSGSTVALLGLALTGIVALRRKFAA